MTRFLGYDLGTQVKNPMRRGNSYGYSQCSGCGKYYTSMGLSRHWAKCPKLVYSPKERRYVERSKPK